MTKFTRREHTRTNSHGTTFRVREHSVRRDHWNSEWFASVFGSPYYKAADLLRRSNVGRGAQGCFVVPNAKCPICSVPVFFYANSHGSRVYFDDLGPPWPKHPCTDNPVRPTHDSNYLRPIVRRKNGEIQELLEAANAIGLFNVKLFGSETAREWSLLIVEEIRRKGERNDITGVIIDGNKKLSLYCFSNNELFQVGDFISVRGGLFSFISKPTLREVNFHIGDMIDVSDGVISVKSAKPGSPSTNEQRLSRRVGDFNPSRFLGKGPSKTERKHFGFPKQSIDEYVTGIAPLIAQMIHEGARYPEDFSVGLNKIGHCTAASEQWTPKLARILVGRIVALAARGRKRTKKTVMRFASGPKKERAIAKQSEDNNASNQSVPRESQKELKAARLASAKRLQLAKRIERSIGGKRVIEFVSPES